MMSNSLWAIIVLVILAGLTFLVRAMNSRALPVVVIHNGMWAGAVLLIGSNLIEYKLSGVGAWLTVILGLTFFNLGVGFAPRPRAASAVGQSGGHTAGPAAIVSRRMLLVLVVIYAIGFAEYIVTISRRFGLSTLITDPYSIRASAIDGVSYLTSVPLVARTFLYLGPLIFAVLCYRRAVVRPLPLVVRLVGAAAMAGSMVTLLQRTNLFVSVLWLVVIVISGRLRDGTRTVDGFTDGTRSVPSPARRARSRGLIAPLIVFGVLLLAAFQLVGGALNKTGQQALSTGTVSPALADSGLTAPFTYYTAGTVAFLQLSESTNPNWPPQPRGSQMVVGDYNPQTWGAATFSSFLNAVPVATAWNPIDPFINTGILTNTYTWLEPFYRDFRVFGVVTAMSGLGVLIGWLYSSRFSSARRFWLQGLFLAAVFLAPFSTRINSNLFIASALLCLLLTIRPSRARRADHRVVSPLHVTTAGGRVE